MFHFMTHAFFKALLFLAAGAVIEALHHEQDMFRMGGLRRELPLTFWAFLIGGSALAGMPLVTAGFFSKDLILWQSWAGPHGNVWFWVAGMTGAFLTSLYTYRLIFLVFYGPQHTHVSRRPGHAMKIAFIVLCCLSLLGGYLDTPPHFGGVPALSNFLNTTLPALEEVHVGPITELITAVCASIVFALGLGGAYLLYGRKPLEQPERGRLEELWLSGWGFDWLYNNLFVRPVAWMTRVNANDEVDRAFTGLASLTQAGHRLLRRTQTGELRWYASGLAVGSAVFLAIILFMR